MFASFLQFLQVHPRCIRNSFLPFFSFSSLLFFPVPLPSIPVCLRSIIFLFHLLFSSSVLVSSLFSSLLFFFLLHLLVIIIFFFVYSFFFLLFFPAPLSLCLPLSYFFSIILFFISLFPPFLYQLLLSFVKFPA